MFGISIPELIIVAAVALLVLGPERLPQTMHSLGRWMGMLKRTTDGLRREFYNSVYTPAGELKGGIDLAERELVAVKREIAAELKSPLCPDNQIAPADPAVPKPTTEKADEQES